MSTEVPTSTRSVRPSTHGIHASKLGAWPPSSRHGWKWSLIVTESNPSSSARIAYAASSPGANCSADALYPTRNRGSDSPALTSAPRDRRERRRKRE